MRFGIQTLAIVGGLAAMFVSPAHAQATRTWVSGVGDDVNPCSRTAPCKTFAGAISKTAAGGEINCLDPGGYGSLTITKSLTVDCSNTLGSTLNSNGVNGFVINMLNNPGDVDRTVRLRGITINGAGDTDGLNGIRIVNANVVHLENLVIYNQSGSGIRDDRTTGNTRLYVKDVSLRKIGGAGVSLAAQNGNAVVLDNVSSLNNGYGLAAIANNRVTIVRSVFSGNATAGVFLDVGANVTMMSTVLSNNNIGLQNTGQASIADSLISSNNQAVTGTVTSFGNNRIVGNVSLGGTLAGAGGPSTDLGQQ